MHKSDEREGGERKIKAKQKIIKLGNFNIDHYESIFFLLYLIIKLVLIQILRMIFFSVILSQAKVIGLN